MGADIEEGKPVVAGTKAPGVKKMQRTPQKDEKPFKSHDEFSIMPELDTSNNLTIIVKKKTLGQMLLDQLVPCWLRFHPDSFEIHNEKGKIMDVTEDSTVAGKLFCGEHRAITFTATAADDNKEMFVVDRPLTCGRRACCHPQRTTVTAGDDILDRKNEEFKLKPGYTLGFTVAQKKKNDCCGLKRVPAYLVMNHKNERIAHVNPVIIPCQHYPWGRILCRRAVTVDTPNYATNLAQVDLRTEPALQSNNWFMTCMAKTCLPKNRKYVISFDETLNNNGRLMTINSALLKHQLDENFDGHQAFAGTVCIC